MIQDYIPWLWIANSSFMAFSSCAPILLTKLQSNGFTSQPLRNYGHKNFVIQAVTGYVYHQTLFNIWSHILTFPIDLMLWAYYFNFYGNMLFPQIPSLMYWIHFVLCLLQLISISLVSNNEITPEIGAQSKRKYEVYGIQFFITCVCFSFWYFIIPLSFPNSMELFRIVIPDCILQFSNSELFWLNTFLVFNALFRSMGHSSDYIPPLMITQLDEPFTSLGKGFISSCSLLIFRWEVIYIFPLGLISELCAGYPGRLYVWRLLANLRRICNLAGIKDEDQVFFSVNWKKADQATKLITHKGWNAWTMTEPIFRWAKQE